MIDVRMRNEVMKQRALGLSFDDIAATTGISKPTIIKICHENSNDISEAKKIAASVAKLDIAQAITKRRLQYTKLVNNGINEILQRDFSMMSNGELLKIVHGSERALAFLETNDHTMDQQTDEWRPMSAERAMIILDKLGR